MCEEECKLTVANLKKRQVPYVLENSKNEGIVTALSPKVPRV